MCYVASCECCLLRGATIGVAALWGAAHQREELRILSLFLRLLRAVRSRPGKAHEASCAACTRRRLSPAGNQQRSARTTRLRDTPIGVRVTGWVRTVLLEAERVDAVAQALLLLQVLPAPHAWASPIQARAAVTDRGASIHVGTEGLRDQRLRAGAHVGSATDRWQHSGTLREVAGAGGSRSRSVAQARLCADGPNARARAVRCGASGCLHGRERREDQQQARAERESHAYDGLRPRLCSSLSELLPAHSPRHAPSTTP